MPTARYNEIVKRLGLKVALAVELDAHAPAVIELTVALARAGRASGLPPLALCHVLRQIQAHLARALLGELAVEASALSDQVIAEALARAAAAAPLATMSPQGHA